MSIEEGNITKKQQVEYYLGTITEVLDPVLYQVKCDIPGEFEGVTAFPTRNDQTEPRVGDFVLLMSFDPIYHSYFLYNHLKENDFIGIRSNGKQIDITPKYIEMSIYDPEQEWGDDQQDSKHRPKATSWITMDKDGNLDISLNGDKSMITLNASDQCDLFLNGDFKIWSGANIHIHSCGNLTLEADGNLNLKGSKIRFGGSKGQGMVEMMGGVADLTAIPGPFIIPAAAPAPGFSPISSYRVQVPPLAD